VVFPIKFTITSWLSNGFPRQFFVIELNMRCSILFHLLVPGGKWQTETAMPVSSAKRCRATFHSLVLLPFFATAAEVPVPSAKQVTFEIHSGYFVSNQFEPKEATSFVVLKDQPSFDKVFGVAMVMGDKSHRLERDAFAKKFVVAAVHRGKGMTTYQVQSVVEQARALVVRYTAETKASDSAEFACPLILSLEKSDCKSVRFVENGKEVKVLKLAAQ